jgi:hypothetical protein
MTKFGLRPNFYKNITSLDETDAKAFKEVTYDIASQAFGHLESAR